MPQTYKIIQLLPTNSSSANRELRYRDKEAPKLLNPANKFRNCWSIVFVIINRLFKENKTILTLRSLTSYIYGAPILDVSRSHTTTQHSRQDSSVRVISSSQRPLPDNTRHSQQTNIHAPGGIRTQDLSRQAACSRSPAEIVGSNPTGGMDICLL